MKLREMAHSRSGDKGANANIGVIANSKEDYDFLVKNLTAAAVDRFFKPLGVVETVRYELPHLLSFNFVLNGVLEKGGSCSLRIDAQGKSLGQAILEMEL